MIYSQLGKSVSSKGRSTKALSKEFALWNSAIAKAIEAKTARAACRAIGIGLSELFDSDTWWFIFFRRNEPPILFDYFDADVRKDRYEDGPYLLDPFYSAFLKREPEGCYLKRKISPKDLSKIAPYMQYDGELFGPMDELGVVIDIDTETRSFVCIARAKSPGNRPVYSERHIALLQSLTPIIQAITMAIWVEEINFSPEIISRRAEKHSHIESFFNTFTRDRLTWRETEVAKLMIKGFSAREISTLLNIAYGTARNHMKKVYPKLEVSSQSELCGLFIEELLNTIDELS